MSFPVLCKVNDVRTIVYDFQRGNLLPLRVYLMNNADNKIRVCFVMPKAYPLFDTSAEGVFGGSERDLYFIAVELAKDRDYDVHFIVADYGQNKTERMHGVKLIKGLSFRQPAVVSFFRLISAMIKINADIYFHKTISPGVPLIAFVCCLLNKRFVYKTASRVEFDGTYQKDHPFLYRLFRRSLRMASVVTQNESDRRMLKENMGIESRVIRNAHSIPAVSRKTCGHILWVGRSVEIKKPRRFLELAGQFPDERFVMICQRATGDDDYESLAGRADQTPNVEFIRRVRPDEIDDYYQRAGVLVNTSDAEGFPNVFIEAGKHSVLILSYAVNPDDFLGKYNCGLCCGGDMQKLRRGLEFLLEDGRYVEIGQNTRKYVEDNHDISKIIEQYKQLFRELTGKKRR